MTNMAVKARLVLCFFSLLTFQPGHASSDASICLADGVPEGERKNIKNNQGQEIPIGIFLGNWATSGLLNTMVQVWFQEVFGYHAIFLPDIGASGASVIFAIAGCTDFDSATDDKGCVNETLSHVSVDSWIGSYAAANENFAKENPGIAGVDLGSMGYDGEESIYVSRAVLEAAQSDTGLALDFYKSYNTTHHDPKKYFDSLSDVDPEKVALCTETDFNNTARMGLYAQFSGDYDGVEQLWDGSYVAKCPDGKWWLAPACRHDPTQCIPTFTASPGWKLHAMMQWTAAYGFPAAIGIGNKWADFTSLVASHRALFYWWVPDNTFINMQPEAVVFPRYSATEWAMGDKKTGGTGSYVAKVVSQNLKDKAPLLPDFVANMVVELQEVMDLLLKHQRSGDASYFGIACEWIKANQERWTRWIPDKTKCEPQFGLYHEQEQMFVSNRSDSSGLSCRACPSGHFSEVLEDTIGTTYICSACPSGTSQASGASLACDPCPRGEYQDELAQSSCKRCPQGLYQNQEGQTACIACPAGTSTLGFGSLELSDCGCKEKTINIGTNGTLECMPCSLGLQCPFSSSLSTLLAGEAPLGQDYVPELQFGFYASQEKPTSVFKCEPADFCPGGSPGSCAGELQGEPCAVCPEGKCCAASCWSWAGGCQECGVKWVFVLLGIPIGLLALTGLYYVGNVQVNAQASPFKVLSMAFGLCINVLQAIALMGMFAVAWMPEMESVSGGLSFMVLDVKALGLQCFLGTEPLLRFAVATLIFPLAIAWLLTAALLSRPLGRLSKRLKPWSADNTINIMGMLLRVGFSTICAVVMEPLMCYRHPNGLRSVLQYPEVICGESQHTSMLILGIVMFCILVLFFYTGCCVAAYRMPTWSATGMHRHMYSFRFLISDFRLDRWWFGLVPLARGFCFALVIVIGTDTPSAQTSLTIMFLVIYCVLQAVLWPWKAPVINVADVILNALLLLLMTKAQPGTTEMEEEWNFSRVFNLTILLGIGLCMIALAITAFTALLMHVLGRFQTRNLLLNVGRITATDLVSMRLKSCAEDLMKVGQNTLDKKLDQLNPVDFRALRKAMDVIEEVVAPSGELREFDSGRITNRIQINFRRSVAEDAPAISTASTKLDPLDGQVPQDDEQDAPVLKPDNLGDVQAQAPVEDAQTESTGTWEEPTVMILMPKDMDALSPEEKGTSPNTRSNLTMALPTSGVIIQTEL